jgi:hypothetical protein
LGVNPDHSERPDSAVAVMGQAAASRLRRPQPEAAHRE